MATPIIINPGGIGDVPVDPAGTSTNNEQWYIQDGSGNIVGRASNTNGWNAVAIPNPSTPTKVEVTVPDGIFYGTQRAKWGNYAVIWRGNQIPSSPNYNLFLGQFTVPFITVRQGACVNVGG